MLATAGVNVPLVIWKSIFSILHIKIQPSMCRVYSFLHSWIKRMIIKLIVIKVNLISELNKYGLNKFIQLQECAHQMIKISPKRLK